jgi:phosphate transport system substrate-binding protein
LTDKQLAESKSGNIIHVPVTLGAVAITYNLNLKDSTGQDFTGHLNLTSAILARIYLGTITSWDDAAIKTANPNVTLPKQNITVVHRSDGSGTTAIFSHYLSAVDVTWSLRVGGGTTVKWPVGVGVKRSEGLTEEVQATAGSIGYTELEYVLSNGLSYAAIYNANRKNVLPSSDGARAAATSVDATSIPLDLRFFIVNASGDTSYPISGFSWAIVYQHQSDVNKGQAIANMLWWMIHKGQQYSELLNYAPLPATIVTKAEAQIKSMTCGASKAPCYTGTASQEHY